MKRRLEQHSKRMEAEAEEAKRRASAAAAKEFLSGLEESVLDKMEAKGAFGNPVSKEINDTFLPWLNGKVDGSLQTVGAVEISLGSMLTTAMARHRTAADLEAERSRARALHQIGARDGIWGTAREVRSQLLIESSSV